MIYDIIDMNENITVAINELKFSYKLCIHTSKVENGKQASETFCISKYISFLKVSCLLHVYLPNSQLPAERYLFEIQNFIPF